MLSDFDQSTIANMTAALDFVCKEISADRDSNELRKRTADELMRCARTGRRRLIDLEQANYFHPLCLLFFDESLCCVGDIHRMPNIIYLR